MTTARQLKRSRLSRLGLRALRFTVTVLPVLAGFFTAFGILLSASTYEPRLAKHMLALCPRHRLAQEALALLENLQDMVKDRNGKEVRVSVLGIDHPSWGIMLDFVQSEIAIRKSERNEPAPASFSSPAGAGSPENSPPAELPPIDFDKIKTIVAAEFETPKAGSKPLTPPYRLLVFWPPTIARRVYEFLSFQEFALDLRQMLVLELRFGAIVASGIAFVTTVVLSLLRRGLTRFAPGVLATAPSGLAASVGEDTQHAVDDGSGSQCLGSERDQPSDEQANH
jgi:hypothetical protein